jgi:AcrR family transcriptional regulator
MPIRGVLVTYEPDAIVRESGGSGRRRLMTAAARLFQTTGLSEVTVAQILDHSGVKAPTLYHHFGGKEGLYVAWASQTLDVIEAEFRALAAAGHPLRVFLVEACRILLSARSMDFLQVMRDRKWLSDPESLEQVNEALSVAVFTPISRAIEELTPIKDGRDAAQLFVHMVCVRRPAYLRADAIEPIPDEEIVDLFVSGVISGRRTSGDDDRVRESAAVEFK